jgi:hypothetical protein
LMCSLPSDHLQHLFHHHHWFRHTSYDHHRG